MSLRICLLAGLPVSLFAQIPTAIPHVPARPPSVVASAADIPLIPDSPFSATAISETNQPTADGTSTATKTTTVIARDSKGRTYAENHYPLAPSDTGNGRIRGITISDPIAHTKTELDPATMQATTFSLTASSGPPSSPTQTTTDDEDLGMSTIEGLSVHGYRHSTTIRLNPPIIEQEPIGNGTQPITTTNEYWFSDQLQMTVMTKTEQTRGPNQFHDAHASESQ